MATQTYLQALEYDKIIGLVANYLQFEESAAHLFRQKPNNDYEVILNQLKLCDQIIESSLYQFLNLKGIFEIRDLVPVILLESSQLDINDLINIKNIIENSAEIHGFYRDKKSGLKSELGNYLSAFHGFEDLCKSFLRVFDSDNQVRDQASEELSRIRMAIKQLEQVVYRQFKKELETYKKMGVLAEGEESVYHGRYVLRISAEQKRKVKGLITGESDSGKTIFIEPQACVELHNEMIELELAHTRELQKILKELTRMCRSQVDELVTAYDQLLSLDILLAKSRLSKSLNGVLPVLAKNPVLKIIAGKHPLLLLRFKETGSTLVPLNLSLDENQHILVISGPNAGGKTIVLKTVGLFQLMLRSGILIPVHPSSEFGIFHHILVDIGDNQSLENDLSTYSAKLSFMRKLLLKANPETLVLIDEFGSGTEPVIGGALAEVILEETLKRKSFGIITTHYSNIKGMAHDKKGLVNGSMLFDLDEKKPKFELIQGIPGSSFALEMAENMKLPGAIIKRAKAKAQKGVVNLESLISNLKMEKQALTMKNEVLESRIQSLNKLIKAYEQMQKQNDLKRLKLKLDSKQLELDVLADRNEKANTLLKEIQEKLDIIEAKKLAEQTQLKLQKANDEWKEINQDHKQLIREKYESASIRIGDQVMLLSNNLVGTVAQIKQNNAEIITDKFTIHVDMADIVPVKKSNGLTIKSKPDLDILQKASTVKGLLDIRGSTPDDAVRALEEYLDVAIVSNLKEARILHGKGSGMLRRTIIQAVRKNKFIKNYRHPEEQDGGLGVTIIEFTQ
ncbi:MAG: Smr/MutS family protein [Saprospiraceae bacterium]|nr:Smr/MutS family protein [Saprospiraceae bacterium]